LLLSQVLAKVTLFDIASWTMNHLYIYLGSGHVN
jgi:hypothetical protein